MDTYVFLDDINLSVLVRAEYIRTYKRYVLCTWSKIVHTKVQCIGPVAGVTNERSIASAVIVGPGYWRLQQQTTPSQII